MVMAPLWVEKELDLSETVDVIIESELNQRVFKSLVEYYQSEREYKPPKREKPKYPKGLSEEDKTDLAYGKFMRRGMENSIQTIEFTFKTLEEMGKIVGESNLEEIEKSLESFSGVNLISIGFIEGNKYYSHPREWGYHLKDSGESIGFYGYLDKILDRMKLISQVSKYLKQ